jgi:hypothetical protein
MWINDANEVSLKALDNCLDVPLSDQARTGHGKSDRFPVDVLQSCLCLAASQQRAHYRRLPPRQLHIPVGCAPMN